LARKKWRLILKLKEFLENVPPYQEEEVEDLNISNSISTTINRPDLFIHCNKCGGERFFDTQSVNLYKGTKEVFNYIYTCKNCNKEQKIYSVMGKLEKTLNSGVIQKIGEYPPYGKPTPAKLISLIGPEREVFLKGRRCENQGLGIGSYAYYRRVIESQKNRIIDQIINICNKYEKTDDLVMQLQAAKQETQFTKAIDLIKDNLPTALLVDGYNPLKLLHKALSKGIHEMDDHECLERASNIRVLLSELSIRISEILKDEKELKEAISALSKL
jgi:hypothetical protein